MSPSAASAWGELCEELGETLWPVLRAWETGCYVEDSDDLPCISDFEDAYQGEWDSFTDYAAQLAEDIGLTDGWPEEAQRYFDREAWTRDLRVRLRRRRSPRRWRLRLPGPLRGRA